MKRYTNRQILVFTIAFSFLLAIIGFVAFDFYAKHKQVTTYTASRSVLISHKITNNNSNSPSDENNNTVQNDVNMMPTYKELVNNYDVAKATHSMLPKKLRHKYSVENLKQDINASSNDQSLILKISVKTGDSGDSITIANKAAAAFAKQIKKIKPDAGRVVVLSKADQSSVSAQTKPHAKKYAIVGFVLGGLFGLMCCVVAITVADFQ